MEQDLCDKETTTETGDNKTNDKQIQMHWAEW